MLTFVSGWATPDRDKVVVSQRDPQRPAILFVDGYSTLYQTMAEVPHTELYRISGRTEFEIIDAPLQVVRVMFDLEKKLIEPAVKHVLRATGDTQIIVLYDATQQLGHLFPHLQSTDAILAADNKLNAPDGAHVIFTRGGSFAWRDYLIESQTAALIDDDQFDVGIIDETLTDLAY